MILLMLFSQIRARSLSCVGSPVDEHIIQASIPGFIMRGGGFDAHVEYELSVSVEYSLSNLTPYWFKII